MAQGPLGSDSGHASQGARLLSTRLLPAKALLGAKAADLHKGPREDQQLIKSLLEQQLSTTTLLSSIPFSIFLYWLLFFTCCLFLSALLFPLFSILSDLLMFSPLPTFFEYFFLYIFPLFSPVLTPFFFLLFVHFRLSSVYYSDVSSLFIHVLFFPFSPQFSSLLLFCSWFHHPISSSFLCPLFFSLFFSSVFHSPLFSFLFSLSYLSFAFYLVSLLFLHFFSCVLFFATSANFPFSSFLVSVLFSSFHHLCSFQCIISFFQLLFFSPLTYLLLPFFFPSLFLLCLLFCLFCLLFFSSDFILLSLFFSSFGFSVLFSSLLLFIILFILSLFLLSLLLMVSFFLVFVSFLFFSSPLFRLLSDILTLL